MKKFLLMFVITGNFIVCSVFASDQAQSIRENVFLGMHQIKLPDGLTVFGESAAVIGDPFCDAKLSSPKDCDTSFARLTDFTNRLIDPRLPESKGWLSFFSNYYSPKELLDIYKHIANAASKYDGDSLIFFEVLLKTGQFSGVKIPGLTPQPERAALYRELFEWQRGHLTDATHALEAIRIERERLADIAAEEEAKRKAEETARIAAIAAAESAKPEFARKASDTGVRRRHVPRTQNTGDDDRATVNDPLISRHPRSH
jgi:hypothetical protein